MQFITMRLFANRPRATEQHVGNTRITRSHVMSCTVRTEHMKCNIGLLRWAAEQIDSGNLALSRR